LAYKLEKLGAKAERPTKPADFSTMADLIDALASKGFRFQALISTGYASGTVTDPVSGNTLHEEGGFAHIIARGGGKRQALLRRMKGSAGTNLIGIVTDEIRTLYQDLEKDL